MNNKRWYRFFVLSLCLVLAACATTGNRGSPPGELLKGDPAVISGVLENGFSYRILPNSYPENRISLRLVVKAGSVLEARNERGIAHLVEHMAFNGSAHFSENQLYEYFETLGMSFGPEVNAYTSFDETVYRLEIPADDPEALNTSLTVISDWAWGLSFDEAELEKERGVVLEEWRLNRGVEGRAWDALLPFLFPFSRYANRMPIGKPDIIQKAPRDRIVNFYKKWYRPELMTLIIVGDADGALLEGAVRERLSAIPASEKPRALPSYPVSVPRTKLSLRLSDPEAPYTEVLIGALFPTVRVRTREDHRLFIAGAVAVNVLSARFDEQVQDGDLFLGSQVFTINVLRSTDAGAVWFNPKPGMFADAFKTAIDEIDRFVEYGVTETELERQKANLRSDALDAWQNRKKTESPDLASRLVESVLNETPFLSADAEYRLALETINALTMDEVNRVIKRYFDKRGSRLLTIAPPDAGVPSKAAINRMWKRSPDPSLGPYNDDLDGRPLFPPELAERPGSIIAERVLSDGNGGAPTGETLTGKTPEITEFTLSNGAKVVVCPTDFKEDFFVFNAVSRGGLSLVSDEEYPSAFIAAEYAGMSGLNGFRQTQVTKKLAGKNVTVGPELSEIHAGLYGSAAARDMESLFQLVNLYFTSPNFTEAAWKRVTGNIASNVEVYQKYPQGYFVTEQLKILYPGSVRLNQPDASFVAALNDAQAREFYRQFYGGAGNFTFVFTGDIALDEVKRLSARYLASLPAGESAEARDTLPAFPGGKQTVRIKKGIDPQSLVRTLFGGVNPEIEGDIYTEQALIAAMVELLEIRLREKIREELGASYGVGVYCHQENYPSRRYTGGINFGCEPARAEELADLVIRELKTLGETPAREEDLVKLREGFSRRRETARKTNEFWQGVLTANIMRGDESAAYSRDETVLAALTPETMPRLIRRYFNTENYLTGILLPEDP
ncbi:insulinase family protein [Treponema sp. TIM-1]|uniref:M16 family metallopeptidase n=1 Tax=Treponema sp. TIM-1 TaxID=2898417 RepID=UPI003981412A